LRASTLLSPWPRLQNQRRSSPAWGNGERAIPCGFETQCLQRGRRQYSAATVFASSGHELGWTGAAILYGGSGHRSGVDLHQVNLLAGPEDNSLPGFDIPRYRPQAESHVERIDAYGAPECQFTELMLQRVTVAAERYGIAIRRLHSGATVRSRANMRRFRGSCSTTDHARKLSDKGQMLHAPPEVRLRLGASRGAGNAGCRQNVAAQGAISRLAYSAAFSASLPGGIRSSFVAQIFSITRSMK
jgi:hypothetical protein